MQQCILCAKGSQKRTSWDYYIVEPEETFCVTFVNGPGYNWIYVMILLEDMSRWLSRQSNPCSFLINVLKGLARNLSLFVGYIQ
jgi:hypothetical protein